MSNQSKLTSLSHAIYDHLPRGEDGEKMEQAIRAHLAEVVQLCIQTADEQWVKDPHVSGGDAIRRLIDVDAPAQKIDVKLVEVQPPSNLLGKPSKEDQDKTILELKSLLKVGMSVDVENGRNEMLVSVKIDEITEDGFFVKYGVRRCFSKFSAAWFVKNGRKLTLGDSEHFYSSVFEF